MTRAACSVLAVLGMAVFAALAGDPRVARVVLSAPDILGPAFAARGVRLELSGDELDRLHLAIDSLRVGEKSWRRVRLECPRFSLGRETLACTEGVLQAPEALPLSFSYSPATGRFTVELRPGAGETWRLAGKAADGSWELKIAVVYGDPVRLADWLPAEIPRPRGGRLDAEVAAAGRSGNWSRLDGLLRFRDLAFSDDAGLHAGEKVAGTLRLEASQKGSAGAWSADAQWTSGEIFWQPVYVAGGGYRIRGHGAFDDGGLRVEVGSVDLGTIGSAEFSGELSRAPWKLSRLELRAANIDLGPLFDVLGRPFFQQTALAEAEAVGQANVSIRFDRGEVQTVDLEVSHAALRDARERFLLGGVEARIPWSRQGTGEGEITIGAGHLLRVPFGPATIPLALRAGGFSVPAARVPLLEGTLTVEDFAAERETAGWRWSLKGGLTPVSMEDLSKALGIHVMHGTLSAVVPQVRYSNATLEVGGALLIKAFDGAAVITGLSMQEPLGRAPRLRAEVDMKGLDLDLLTRTFDFGSMQGKVDVTVHGLELSNWRPVALDARVVSSPGNYPRKISQRAVQNISALGGAGAAAAIQRSFVGMFEQFGYSRLGLSCRLERGICHMDGIEDAPNGYVIVKGGGIPALTVMGYNRTVSWSELLARLQRITRDNVKPVIK